MNSEVKKIKRQVCLGLGSNLGDREAQIRAALSALQEGGVTIEAVSALYETQPWGVTSQSSFLNIAILGETALSPFAILDLAKGIEAKAGRDFEAPRWTARPMDVDILLIEGEVIQTDKLSIPHMRMNERGFVLVPLADIARSAIHPKQLCTVGDLLKKLPSAELAGVIKRKSVGWHETG